jgi:protein gp37
MNKIGWCTETWNPIIGCSKVSAGCVNCYAERMAIRLSNILAPGEYYRHVIEGGFTIPAKWNGKTYFVESALQRPFHWKQPRMIFVCSMGDLFHESVPFEWIVKVYDVISRLPRHTFQILTKRPERMLEYYRHIGQQVKDVGFDSIPSQSDELLDYAGALPNLCVGVTIENQEQLKKRILPLLEIPAAVKFVSCEPLLSNIHLQTYLIPGADGMPEEVEKYHDYIDWVIAGPETGPHARPCKKEWIQSLYDQCKSAGVPFYDKKDILNLNLKQLPK